MSASSPFVFVIMPFAPAFDDVYSNIDRLAGALGAKAVRADSNQREGQQISENIVKLIRRADLVVADISKPNPNIYYEIGYAHALGKSVFMIARDLSTVAFDIRNYPVVAYGERTYIRDFASVVREPFEEALDDALRAPTLRQPVIDTLDYIDDVESPRDDLFCRIMRSYLGEVRDRARQWSSGRIYVDKDEAIHKGIEIFRKLERGGFVTFLVKINEFWNSTDAYAVECRTAAQRHGIDIERVFIAPDVDSLFHPPLRERIQLDEQSGIRTYIALSRAIEVDAVHDFGIWDDQVLCLIETNPVRPHQVNGATFSRSKAELETAKDWKRNILAKSERSEAFLNKLDEIHQTNPRMALLLRSADAMADAAQKLCHGSHISLDNCQWYHQAWQYLRLLDMVSTPQRHSEFYRTALENALAQSEVAHILICGTADYGMLQQVVASVPEDKISRLRVHVLDLCPTPLAMCEWFSRVAREPGRPMPIVSPMEDDALCISSGSDEFHVIVTDAFLTRFTSEDKTRVLSEWQRVLRPGGCVITTARLANGRSANSGDGQMRSAAHHVEEFANRAVAEARTWGNVFPIALSDLHILARRYAEKIVSSPFPSQVALRTLFESTGFSIDRFEARPVKGEFHASTVYGRVVARKGLSSS